MDNIKITDELKNEIPDRSWMLYLLEVFNTQNIAVELNLISQYDDQNYFRQGHRFSLTPLLSTLINEVNGNRWPHVSTLPPLSPSADALPSAPTQS